MKEGSVFQAKSSPLSPMEKFVVITDEEKDLII